MTSFAKAVKLAENIYWVGARDWDIRDFHGYAVNRGSTYNAFLIIDEKVTLIDTVKKPFFSEMIERISSVIDPKKIDYIVSNHAEMDHSGALPETLAYVKPEKVFVSMMGEKALTEHFGSLPLTVVKTGDEIKLGHETLAFIETRMLHWPDSMFTYLRASQILFSQDAFGMHLATEAMYSDEVDDAVIRYEAKRYFANILLPYAPQVLKLLESFEQMNLPVTLLAPDHGPLHRKGWISGMLQYYREFAEQKPVNKAVVIYATMWGSTAKMARAIAEGLRSSGMKVKLMPLSGSHRSDVMTEMIESGVVVFGSPTLNNQIYPTMADTLCYMRGLRPKNCVAGVFASYGWSGESYAQLSDAVKAMNLELVENGPKVKYVPTHDDLIACAAYGEKLGSVYHKLYDGEGE